MSPDFPYPSAGLEAELADARNANVLLRGKERWYQNAIEAAEIGTWAWDLVTGILTWSQRCKALFGLPPEAVINYDVFLERLHPEDRERVHDAVQSSLQERTPYDTFGRIVTPDGLTAWRRFKGRTFQNDNGETVRFEGVVIDASRQKKVEEDLRRALERERQSHDRAAVAESEARNILESMAEGFYGLDENFCLTYINAAAEEILDRKRDDVLGKRLWDVFPETVGTDLETNYRRALTEQRTLEFSTHLDVWNRWFIVKVYPSAAGLAIYFREVTRQKQMEVALLDSQERFQLINDFNSGNGLDDAPRWISRLLQPALDGVHRHDTGRDAGLGMEPSPASGRLRKLSRAMEAVARKRRTV